MTVQKEFDFLEETIEGIRHGNSLESVRTKLIIRKHDIKEQLNISGVVKSLPYAYKHQLDRIEQLDQTQQGLDLQLSVLKAFANKLGLYDASDYINTYCK